MPLVVITAKDTKSNSEGSFVYDFPDTAHGLVEAYGDTVVYEAALQTFKSRAQTAIRSAITKGTPTSALTTTWSPVPTNRGADIEKLASKAKNLSPEKLAELIAKLQS